MSAAAEELDWTRELRRLGAAGAGGSGLSFRGPVASFALHGLALLLIILGLPSLMQPPPEPPQPIPVDLVELGEKTAAPVHQQAALPQQKAPETAPVQPPLPVPVPKTPPPVVPLPAPPSVSGPMDPLADLSFQGTPAPPKVTPKQKPKPPAAAKPVKKPAPPVEDLAATLQSLTLQQQLQARTPPTPAPQEGSGQSDVTTGSDAFGPLATLSAKDFIRAQIARHWYLDRAAIGAGQFTIALHLVLTADGRVSLAEILDSASYGQDVGYRAAALSLRSAALMSSPLSLPPGHYAEVRDVVLTFSPRLAMQ